MLLASVLVAAKFLDDFRLNCKDFAKIGGVSTEELFVLELDMLSSLDFKLFVEIDHFLSYTREILQNVNHN